MKTLWIAFWLFLGSSPLMRGLWRALRATIAMAIAMFLVNLAQEPAWLLVAPLLLGLSKWLRDSQGVDLKVI